MGYESLFTPFKIGNMEVKNRIGLSPMGTNSAFTNGRKDAQEIDYFQTGEILDTLMIRHFLFRG